MEKMMKFAGRSSDGLARAIKTDTSGVLETKDLGKPSRLINEGDVNLPIGVWTDWITFEEMSSVASFYGRITPSSYHYNIDIEIRYNYVDSNVLSKAITFSLKSTSGRFVSDFVNFHLENMAIRIKRIDGGADAVLSHLYIKPATVSPSSVSSGGATGGSAGVLDMDGNSVSLTAELDESDKAVLRVVDAAPHAYDEGNDALKVVSVGSAEVNSGVWTLADKVEMRTTTYKDYNLQSASGLTPNQIRRFRKFKISLHDTHDKIGKVEIFTNNLASGVTGANVSATLYQADDITEGNTLLIYASTKGGDSIDSRYKCVPNLADLHSNLTVRVTFQEPPTTGSISIVVEAQI